MPSICHAPHLACPKMMSLLDVDNTFQVCNKLVGAQAAFTTTPGHCVFAFDVNEKGVKPYAVASIAKFESLG